MQLRQDHNVIQRDTDDGLYGGVAVNKQGRIAVTDQGFRGVYLLRQNSTLAVPPIELRDHNHRPVHISLLCGVAFGQNNHFWVTDCMRNKVLKLSQDGEVVQTIHQAGGCDFNLPCGVAVCPKGLIYICDSKNHRVVVYDDINNEEVGFLMHPDKKFEPTDITFSSDGCVYVADNVNKRVCVFGENGNYKRDFNVPYYGRYLAATEDNHLVVASNTSKAVMVYTLNGVPVDEFGGESDPGRFEGPCGICVDNNGQVYVADNNCVRVFIRR